MPKVKPLIRKNARDLAIKGAIASAMTVCEKSNEQMARAMGMGYVTWLRRMKDPGTFSLDEIGKMKQILPGLQIPI